MVFYKRPFTSILIGKVFWDGRILQVLHGQFFRNPVSIVSWDEHKVGWDDFESIAWTVLRNPCFLDLLGWDDFERIVWTVLENSCLYSVLR